MDALELLRTRYSASKLGEPPPSAQAIQAMLESANRAPDHGQLRPWRLILIEGNARQRFGEVLAAALTRRNPSADDHARARERDKALRAPLIIVVATRCDRSSRVPLIEQILSAGAAAHGIMLAAFAQGFGAMWRTGEAAYDDTVKAALGVKVDDAIVGFIYVGTQLDTPPPRSPRVGPAAVYCWVGDNLDPGAH